VGSPFGLVKGRKSKPIASSNQKGEGPPNRRPLAKESALFTALARLLVRHAEPRPILRNIGGEVRRLRPSRCACRRASEMWNHVAALENALAQSLERVSANIHGAVVPAAGIEDPALVRDARIENHDGARRREVPRASGCEAAGASFRYDHHQLVVNVAGKVERGEGCLKQANTADFRGDQ
jgi:hypothetical protein